MTETCVRIGSMELPTFGHPTGRARGITSDGRLVRLEVPLRLTGEIRRALASDEPVWLDVDERILEVITLDTGTR